MTSKPNAPTRTRVATCRFEPAEYATLEAAAAGLGLSVSEAIRRSVTETALPVPRTPQLDASAIVELRRIGTNLNQTVQILHRWQEGKAKDKDRERMLGRWESITRELATAVDTLARRLR
jgi:uncharacterized protein YfaS (alpha-2-macroglobulin family)